MQMEEQEWEWEEKREPNEEQLCVFGNSHITISRKFNHRLNLEKKQYFIASKKL